MLISYHPLYSVLHNCNLDIVEYLSKALNHDIPMDLLNYFNKSTDLILTKSYLFEAYKNTDQTFDIKLYSGFVGTVIKDLYKNNFIDIKNIKYINYIDKYTPANFSFDDYLMEHQKSIINSCLINKRGIIKSPTSSGKSVVIADLVQRFLFDDLKILITVPSILLLHQMAKDLNNYFNYLNLPNINIGMIGDGIFNIQNVTIGISKSLSKLNKTKSFLNSIDVLLCDEVHLSANTTYLTIIENTIKRKITLGFSATPDLSNDLDKLIEGMFGPRIITITEDQMIKNKVILEPVFKFFTPAKAFLPQDLNYKALNISNLLDHHRYKIMPQVYNYLIINNKDRNNLILQKGLEQISKNEGPIVIIVNSVSGKHNHAELLHDLFLLHNIDLPILSTYITKSKKLSILNNLLNNSIKGIIAGPKIITAGVSIPALSCIIIACAGKSNTDFIQRVGRLLRKKEGKQRPLIIDFYDQQYWFLNQAKSRINIAKAIYGETNVEIC